MSQDRKLTAHLLSVSRLLAYCRLLRYSYLREPHAYAVGCQVPNPGEDLTTVLHIFRDKPDREEKPTRAQIEEAISAMADFAEERGATPDDGDHTVKALVQSLDFGFLAWLCVCAELADRQARRQGYKSQADRAAKLAFANRN